MANRNIRLKYFICVPILIFSITIILRLYVWLQKTSMPPAISQADFPLRLTPSYDFSPHTISELDNLKHFFHYLDHPSYKCDKQIVLGGVLMGYRNYTFEDGDKNLCLDGKLKIENCTVLSFGINNEWSFEDAIAALGCKVFAFDPSMKIKDHQRSENIYYYNLGLDKFTGTTSIGKVTTYEKIVEKLHLLNNKVTYLKIDIEGTEIPFFEQVLESEPNLLKNVNQIGMEIHTGKWTGAKSSRYHKFWTYFQKLEKIGFRLTHTEINRHPAAHFIMDGVKRSTCCFEVVWVNLNAL